MNRTTKTPAERFWEKVDKSGPIPSWRPDLDPCWIWQAGKNGAGYGYFKLEGRQQRAHRVVLMLFDRPIPQGLVVDHLCRIPACVNPAHLEIVTQQENTLRGDTFQARNARKTHCKRGHEFTPENTYIVSLGLAKGWARRCATCAKARARRRQELGVDLPRRRAAWADRLRAAAEMDRAR